MRHFSRTTAFRILLAACVFSFVLTLPPLGFCQGCSLCYTQAASSGARLIQALRSGIVILIFPPVSICFAAIVLAYRRRNQFREPYHPAQSDSDW